DPLQVARTRGVGPDLLLFLRSSDLERRERVGEVLGGRLEKLPSAGAGAEPHGDLGALMQVLGGEARAGFPAADDAEAAERGVVLSEDAGGTRQDGGGDQETAEGGHGPSLNVLYQPICAGSPKRDGKVPPGK